MILACDKNWGIGNNNDLVYSFKSDLKHFKKMTEGKTVVMGRKTWESLPFKLPNRKNVVLTAIKKLEDVDMIVHNIHEVLELSSNENIWIIGGAEVYKQMAQYADRIVITHIDAEKECDTNVRFLEDILHEFDCDEDLTILKNERDPDTGKYTKLTIKTYV